MTTAIEPLTCAGCGDSVQWVRAEAENGGEYPGTDDWRKCSDCGRLFCPRCLEGGKCEWCCDGEPEEVEAWARQAEYEEADL